MIFARIGYTVLCVVACVTLVTACGGNKCKSACKKVEQCLGGSIEDDNTKTNTLEPLAGGSDTSKPDLISGSSSRYGTTDCSAITECSELDNCKAKCILDASCDAIRGVDTSGAMAMASCISQCTSTTPRPVAKADGSHQIYLDGGYQWDGSTCTPNCYDKECGDDGCGGTCGTCPSGTSCDIIYGTCSSSCTPDCYGKECGDDGCGGSCGTCGYGQTCDAYGTCTSTSTSNNSGQICNASAPCTSSTEVCMSFATTATNGMCLAQCATAGDLCPVSSSSSQMAVCALTTQQDPNQYYCAYICEISGSTYSCPNSYDYSCEVLDTSQPDVKLCMPK